MMAQILRDEGYKLIVLDGDASNPGGLARLMFGATQGPKALISFFGGREKVECPVDDPAPLTRIDDPVPITEKNIDLILVVVDPTFESLLIAEKITDLCVQMGKVRVWTVLNKVQIKEMELTMRGELKKKNIETLGVVHFDNELIKAGLMGSQLCASKAYDDMKMIIKNVAETL